MRPVKQKSSNRRHVNFSADGDIATRAPRAVRASSASLLVLSAWLGATSGCGSTRAATDHDLGGPTGDMVVRSSRDLSPAGDLDGPAGDMVVRSSHDLSLGGDLGGPPGDMVVRSTHDLSLDGDLGTLGPGWHCADSGTICECYDVAGLPAGYNLTQCSAYPCCIQYVVNGRGFDGCVCYTVSELQTMGASSCADQQAMINAITSMYSSAMIVTGCPQ